jgi:hypothetical protein
LTSRTHSSSVGEKKRRINLNLRRLFGFCLANIIYITFCCFIIARNEFHLIYGQYDPIPPSLFFQFESFRITFFPLLMTAAYINFIHTGICESLVMSSRIITFIKTSSLYGVFCFGSRLICEWVGLGCCWNRKAIFVLKESLIFVGEFEGSLVVFR